eukprot:CAMPEP_0196775316 /NCGR_PEP_ID=MMETSP1104-20130614/3955_1 /TAXON_ID=33652 /ORGANISM="Cafeteria sp., Strain Caron Lab Isolate" /LENGTH=47 /DNA_ID= /DNA_START= /DNA_END= /DNA_ORIENTATION=
MTRVVTDPPSNVRKSYSTSSSPSLSSPSTSLSLSSDAESAQEEAPPI